MMSSLTMKGTKSMQTPAAHCPASQLYRCRRQRDDRPPRPSRRPTAPPAQRPSGGGTSSPCPSAGAASLTPMITSLDQAKPYWYMPFIQHPFADTIVLAADPAFVDPVWSGLVPGVRPDFGPC